MNKAEKDYRTLLKKASLDKKTGPLRIALPAVGALVVLYIGITQVQFDIILMGLLICYLAYLHYDSYVQSKKLLRALEHLASHWQQLDFDQLDKIDTHK